MVRILPLFRRLSVENALKFAALALLGATCERIASGGVTDFTETFDTSASNWRNAQLAVTGWNATGGVNDSGHIATPFRFNQGGGAGGTTAVLFRAHDEFNASGNAFVGDWVAGGVYQLNAYVRHSAPAPLTFFTRIATPFNFPGATAVQFVAVPPNAWTPLTFLINPSSPQWVTFEGSTYNTVLRNVGHIQIGIEIPSSLASDATTYEVDLDQVAIRVVPEPPVALLLGALALATGILRRNSSH